MGSTKSEVGAGRGADRRAGRAHLRRAAVLAVLLAVAGTGVVACTPLLPASVGGTVRDAAGNALPGVVVQLTSTTAPTPLTSVVTGADGEYSFGIVAGGSYRVGVTDPALVHRDTWWPTAPAWAGGSDVVVDGAARTIDVVVGCAGDPPVAGCARAPATIAVTTTPAGGVHPGETQTIAAVVPTAAGDPVPTGTFSVVGVGTPAALVDGGLAASITLQFAGSWSFPVTYSGDAYYAPVTVPVGITVLQGMAPFVGAGAKVGVMGDSITYWSRSSIDPPLADAGYDRSVTGVPGADTVSLQWLVDAYAGAAPDVFVLNLGTNDVSAIVNGLPDRSVAQYEESVLAMAARFPQACFVVTTISAQRTAATTADYALRNAVAGQMDDWLRATFPHVVDWDVAVRDAAAAGTPLLVDEVHPNDAGSAVLGQLTLAQVDACTGRLATATR